MLYIDFDCSAPPDESADRQSSAAACTGLRSDFDLGLVMNMSLSISWLKHGCCFFR